MKHLYFTAVFEPEPGKYYAGIVSTSYNNNLLAQIERLKDIIILHPSETKKHALELADFWNSCYKANKSYYFNRSENDVLY